MTPLVAARWAGKAPSVLPKTRTWSFSKSHFEPWDSAQSTASFSLAASMPTSAGALCRQVPAAGKYEVRGGGVVCAGSLGTSTVARDRASKKDRVNRLVITGDFLRGSVAYFPRSGERADYGASL